MCIQTLSLAPRPLPAPPGTFFRTCSCHNSRVIHSVPRRRPLPEDVIIMRSIETLNSLATIMLGSSKEYGRILKLNIVTFANFKLRYIAIKSCERI